MEKKIIHLKLYAKCVSFLQDKCAEHEMWSNLIQSNSSNQLVNWFANLKTAESYLELDENCLNWAVIAMDSKIHDQKSSIDPYNWPSTIKTHEKGKIALFVQSKVFFLKNCTKFAPDLHRQKVCRFEKNRKWTDFSSVS